MTSRPALAVRNKNVLQPAINNLKAAPAVHKPAVCTKSSEVVSKSKPSKSVNVFYPEPEIDHYIHCLAEHRQLDQDFLKNTQIDGRMRSILLDWLAQIQSKFRLSAETFYLSCSLVDRVIKPLKVTRHNLQLIGLACIFVASKFEEVIVPNVHDYVFMGGDICTIDGLFEAEQSVLKTIRFKMFFAYPIHYLRKIRVHMCEDQIFNYELSKPLVDIAIIDINTCCWLPTQMAAVGIKLSFWMCKQKCPAKFIELTNEKNEKEIEEKLKLLASRVSTYFHPEAKLQGLRHKYKGTSVLKKLEEILPRLKSHFK